jgi:hypothetical protein
VTVIRDVGGLGRVTLGFARDPAAGAPVVSAAGRFLAPEHRYFPRMHSPVAADDLVVAIQAEVAAGAAWVKIIGDAPQWGPDGPVPKTNAETYDLDTLRQAVDAAHAAGARVAVHTNLPDFGLIEIGADSIEHGTGLDRAAVDALGRRGGAWTPTLCAVLGGRNSDDPEIRRRTAEVHERLAELLPYAVTHGVRVLAGTDVVGTIADEIALLVEIGLTPAQAITAAGSHARDFLGVHPDGDIVTYDADPLADPAVLARPAAVVVRGFRVRLSAGERHRLIRRRQRPARADHEVGRVRALGRAGPGGAVGEHVPQGRVAAAAAARADAGRDQLDLHAAERPGVAVHVRALVNHGDPARGRGRRPPRRPRQVPGGDVVGVADDHDDGRGRGRVAPAVRQRHRRRRRGARGTAPDNRQRDRDHADQNPRHRAARRRRIVIIRMRSFISPQERSRPPVIDQPHPASRRPAGRSRRRCCTGRRRSAGSPRRRS